MTVYASIITYNPKKELLGKAVSAVINQVDKLVIVDNCSDNGFNFSDISDHISEEQNSKTVFISNDRNTGIAEALNIAVGVCNKDCCEWLLTLDQDSVVPADLIDSYLKYMDLDNIGQLCCGFVDNNQTDLEVEKMSPLTIPVFGEKKDDCYKVYACITSGSLLNVPACLKAGGFNNDLFIDYVDYDISLKLYNKGFSNYYIPSVKMHHEFGNAHIKRFLWLRYTDYRFSPSRVYYKARNAVYMKRKYPEFKALFTKSLIYDLMCIVLGFRIKCLGQFIKGLKDSGKLK